MTDWVQVQGASGWQQWADVAQADELIAIAADWTSPQSLQGAALDPAKQRLVVQGALAALGSAFQSLNMPPLASPMYRILYNQYFGSVTDVNANDAAGGLQHSQYLGVGTLSARLPHALMGTDQAQAIQNCAINAGVRLVLDHLDESGNVFVERNYLGQYGVNTLETLWTWDVITGVRDPLATQTNLIEAGQPSSLDWGTLAWQSGPNSGLNIGQPAVPSGVTAPCGVDVILYPYIWQIDFINDVIAAWQAVGAAQVLDDARNYCAVLNAYNAGILGIGPQTFAQQSAGMAQALATWTSDPNNPARAQMRAYAMGMLSTAVTMAAGGPYGWVGGLIIGIVALAQFVLSYAAPIAVGYLTDPFGRMIPDPSKPTTSAWQPTTLVPLTAAAPTDAQLKIPSPSDLAPPGVTLPNPNAPSTQAPPPVDTTGGAQLSGKRLVSRAPVGTLNPLLVPTANIGSLTAGLAPGLVTSTQPFTSTVPVQGTAVTPVAASTQTASGQYVGANGQIIAAPQTAPVPSTPTAPVAPAPTSSALSAAIDNPVVVSGAAAALTGVGVLINRMFNR